MKPKIIDYFFLNLVATVSTNSARPEPNTFSFTFTQEDVAVAAIELGIIKQPYDMDGGRDGQTFRIGYQMAGEQGETQYFDYKTMLWWISGEDREAIVLNLAMQQPEISNQILAELI